MLWKKIGKTLRFGRRVIALRHLRRDYATLLQAARSLGCWMTTQGNVVDWWEARKNLRLSQTAKDYNLFVTVTNTNSNPLCFALSVDNETSSRLFPLSLDPSASTEVSFDLFRPIPRETKVGLRFKRGGIEEDLAMWMGMNTESDLLGMGVEADSNWAVKLEDKRLFQRGLIATEYLRLRESIRNTLKEQGIPLVTVWYWPAEGKSVFTSTFMSRHDVDQIFSSRQLFNVADIEREHGCQSTFYLKAFSETYCPEKVSFDKLIREGHEIAYHSQLKSFEQRGFNSRAEAARWAKEKIERATGCRLKGTCAHSGDWEGEATLSAAYEAGFRYTCGNHFRGPIFPINLRKENDRPFWYLFENRSEIYLEPIQTVVDELRSTVEKNFPFLYLTHPEYFLLG